MTEVSWSWNTIPMIRMMPSAFCSPQNDPRAWRFILCKIGKKLYVVFRSIRNERGTTTNCTIKGKWNKPIVYEGVQSISEHSAKCEHCFFLAEYDTTIGVERHVPNWMSTRISFEVHFTLPTILIK
jgi:hypothetical protein